MNYDEIAHLQNAHPTWALMRSPHVSLILSFLGRAFVDANASAILAHGTGRLTIHAIGQALGISHDDDTTTTNLCPRLSYG